jgi:RNA polymerase II elongation factor ELL
MILRALRVPLIHLLAVQPSREVYLAETCRTSLANVRDLLPKIAKRSSDDTEKWQLTDKSFRELNPWKFTYKQTEDREQAINSAVKSFDRLRLAKDDKLWQILLPVNERGQGKCLSRLSVKAPEQKPSTPLHKTHKLPKVTEKKPAAPKKTEEKGSGQEGKKMKEVKEAKEPSEPKPKKTAREKTSAPAVKEQAHASTATSTSSTKPPAPSNSTKPSTNGPKIRTKKVPVPETSSTPRARPKMSSRDMPLKDRAPRPARPAAPVNTKPKNPSPLSASPPVNASDFEDSHPVHKALSGAPSPAKTSPGNSDRSLKRKANDIDSDIHNHSLSVKQARVDRPTPAHTPSSTNGRLNGSTPSSANSVKRKSDDSSTSNTPSTKVRKVTNINTGLASRYPNNNSQISPGSSSSATSPSVPSLSFRQTVELSQKFQTYYKKYEELYWQLAEADTAPTEAQRNDLMKMHKKLEEMKREIKAGAGVTR